MRRRLTITLAVAAAVPAIAGPAAAAPGLVRVVQDDATLLAGSPALRDRTLDEMRAAGVDVVRVNLIWRRFEGRDAARWWAAADELVRAVSARGMRVLATPTTPAPDRAAQRRPGVPAGTWRPDPRAFAAFVAAAARRYDGGPASPGRIALWSLINEPNNGHFLTPQQRDGRRVAPALYRGLVRAALPQLAAAGHDGSRVLIGEQLGVGRAGGDALASIRPRAFLRDLLCLDSRDRPTRRPEGCSRRFEPLDAGGWAVHPYSAPKGNAVRPVDPDTLTPATLGRLLPTLDAARRARRTTRRLDLWATEGGVQTNPPDRVFGTSPARQAAIVNDAEARLWRAPRVRAWAQYLWRDEPRTASFQSGLRYAGGRAKPAYAAFGLPFVARRAGRRAARVWVRLPPGISSAVLSDSSGRRRELRVTRPDRVIVARVRVAAGRAVLRVRAGGRRSRRVVLAAH